MSKRTNIEPQDFSLAVGAKQAITVTVIWDAEDPPVTADDLYRFDRNPTVSNVGDVTIVDPPDAAFPVTVPFVPDSSGARSATASITVRGKTLGLLGLKGTDPKGVIGFTECSIRVFPARVLLRYENGTGFTHPAMQVTDQDYDLTTAPQASRSDLVVEAVDADNPGVNVGPLYPVELRFLDVRETMSDIAGKFYANGNQVIPMKGSWGDAGAAVATVTDDNGQVTLTVVANENDGYISCSAAGGNVVTEITDIFLFDPDKNPDISLKPPSYLGPADISHYDQPTFPVDIEASVAYDEKVGLFLNGHFEGETPGSLFSNDQKPVPVTARTQDLIVTADPGDLSQYNRMFYCVTKAGDLQNSVIRLFSVKGTPPPSPVNPILSKLIQPAGEVINYTTLTNSDGSPRSVDAVMDVKSDVGILKDKMNMALTTAMKLRIIVISEGYYYKTGKFETDGYQFDTGVTDAMLTSSSVHIPIPRDYLYGYGYPPNAASPPQYTVWYGYVNASSDLAPFASSPIATGPLLTFPI